MGEVVRTSNNVIVRPSSRIVELTDLKEERMKRKESSVDELSSMFSARFDDDNRRRTSSRPPRTVVSRDYVYLHDDRTPSFQPDSKTIEDRRSRATAGPEPSIEAMFGKKSVDLPKPDRRYVDLDIDARFSALSRDVNEFFDGLMSDVNSFRFDKND